jgi:hypothetical protein
LLFSGRHHFPDQIRSILMVHVLLVHEVEEQGLHVLHLERQPLEVLRLFSFFLAANDRHFGHDMKQLQRQFGG